MLERAAKNVDGPDTVRVRQGEGRTAASLKRLGLGAYRQHGFGIVDKFSHFIINEEGRAEVAEGA